MLSDHERSVLSSIEHDLYDDDPEFANAFRTGRCPRVRRARHWPSLLLTASGVAMILIGLLGRIDPAPGGVRDRARRPRLQSVGSPAGRRPANPPNAPPNAPPPAARLDHPSQRTPRATYAPSAIE
jgi:hypothetical protein